MNAIDSSNLIGNIIQRMNVKKRWEGEEETSPTETLETEKEKDRK